MNLTGYQATPEGKIVGPRGHALYTWKYETDSTTKQEFVVIRGKQLLVSRVVATLTIPNPHNLPEVRHKDGDSTNNAPSNLEWCSHADAIRLSPNFIPPYGEWNGRAVLDIADVVTIWRLRWLGGGPRAIAKSAGVSHQNISDILNGKRWRHVHNSITDSYV